MDLPSDAFVTELEREIMAQIRSHEVCSAVPVFSARDLSVVGKLEKELAEMGLCCLVELGNRSIPNNNRRDVVWGEQSIHIRCFEDYFFNRAANGLQLPCDRLAEAVAEALYQFRPAALGGNQMLLADTPTIEDLSTEETLIYRVRYKTL